METTLSPRRPAILGIVILVALVIVAAPGVFLLTIMYTAWGGFLLTAAWGVLFLIVVLNGWGMTNLTSSVHLAAVAMLSAGVGGGWFTNAVMLGMGLDIVPFMSEGAYPSAGGWIFGSVLVGLAAGAAAFVAAPRVTAPQRSRSLAGGHAA